MNRNGCTINHRKNSSVEACRKCSPRTKKKSHQLKTLKREDYFKPEPEVPVLLSSEEYHRMADELESELDRVNKTLDITWDDPSKSDYTNSLYSYYLRGCVTENAYRALALVQSESAVDENTIQEAKSLRKSMVQDLRNARDNDPEMTLDPVEDQAYLKINNYLRSHSAFESQIEY